MDAYLESSDTLDSRQFILAVKRLADSLGYGTDASPYRGSGIEYAQSRPYEPGDPVKAIDWRVTARTSKYYIKEYEAPKRMPVYLLVDTSASMTISSRKLSKYALAVHIAGGIAFACLDRISPVGVLAVGSRDFHVTPSLSRQQILKWLHELRRYRLDETTRLGRSIVELRPSLSTRCLIVVLSDFHDPESIAAIKSMAQQHDCVALQLIDPAEEGVPGAGFVRAREVETGTPFVTRGGHRWVDTKSLRQELRRGGVDHLMLRTDARVAHELRNFFKGRGLLGRGAR
jgi:uncharacterized protein (DUF58 family)